MVEFLTAGIAGHVDHGKTSLVRCLTGIDTDRLRIEKERGLSIESHHEKHSEARAGQRVGINLHRISLGEIRRGMVLAAPGCMETTSLLNVDLRVLDRTQRPVKNRQRVKLYLGTSVINTRVILLEKEDLLPNDRGLAQFRLMRLVAALPGDPFVICLLNIQTVIGGGNVIEIPREKYRQSRACTTIPYLKALQENDLKGFMDQFFAANLLRPVTSGALSKETGFPVAEVETVCRAMVRGGRLLSFKGRGVFSKSLYQELKEKVPGVAEGILRGDALKKGVTAEEIRRQLAPSLDEPPFQRMLAELCNEGRLVKSGGSLRIDKCRKYDLGSGYRLVCVERGILPAVFGSGSSKVSRSFSDRTGCDVMMIELSYRP